jgi:hypothetical protein
VGDQRRKPANYSGSKASLLIPIITSLNLKRRLKGRLFIVLKIH